MLQADLDRQRRMLVETQERDAVQGQLGKDLLELAIRVVPEDDAATLLDELVAQGGADSLRSP